jgi:hypothetical protein
MQRWWNASAPRSRTTATWRESGAYAITAAVCSLAFARFWRVMSGLLLYAVAVKFLQRYAPGRNVSLEDFWLFGFQRGVMVASRSQLGRPA